MLQQLLNVVPSLKAATPQQLQELEASGFYSSEFATERGLPMELVALRAGFYFIPFSEDEADRRFDAWVDYTDSIGVEFDVFEAVDMSLCFA